MSYDGFVLARGDLAAYFPLDTPRLPSPTALTFPGADNTAPGVHVNDLSGPLSLTGGTVLMVRLTSTLAGGTNPDIGLFSAAGSVNIFGGPNPATGYYAFTVPSTRTDYFIYVYTGGTYAAGLTGAGTYGIGGADQDIGPNSIGYLAAFNQNGSQTNFPVLQQGTLLGGGQVGGSVLFNAANCYLRIGDHAALDLGDTWTLSALVMFNSVAGQRAIVSKGSGAYYLRTNGTDLEAVRSLVAVLASSTGTLATATRYHVVATKSGSTRKLYVDGTDVTDTLPGNSTTADNAADLNIGNDVANNVEQYSGWIERVALFNAAMSPTDVGLFWAEVDTPTGGGGSGARSVAVFMG